jgi:hypothetical protein
MSTNDDICLSDCYDCTPLDDNTVVFIQPVLFLTVQHDLAACMGSCACPQSCLSQCMVIESLNRALHSLETKANCMVASRVYTTHTEIPYFATLITHADGKNIKLSGVFTV